LWNKKYHCIQYRKANFLREKVLIKFFELIGSVPPYSKETDYDTENLPLLSVWFERFYSFSDLPLAGDGPLLPGVKVIRKGRSRKKKIIRATALVVDPINPTNNVWLTLGDKSNIFVRRARETAELIKQK